MKKILFFAAAALSLAACSNEGVITDGVDIPQPSEGTNLSLSLSLPNGEPITYAGIHTDKEREVSSLDVYQFNGNNASAKLEAIYSNVTVDRGPADVHKANIHVKSTGNKQFIVVANNIEANAGSFNLPTVVPSQQNLIPTFESFKANISKKLASTVLNAKPLVMTGSTAAINVTTAGPNKVKVDLVRVMARLDIVNKDPLLRLDRVRILNTRNEVYLLPKDNKEGLDGTASAPATPPVTATSVFANELPWITLPTSSTASTTNPAVGYEKAGDVTTYKHVFYPYPSNKPTAEAQAVTLLIEGTLYPNDAERKQTVRYKHVLKKDGEPTFLGFTRNHIYKFVINKATKDLLDAKIKVKVWNSEEIEKDIVDIVAPVVTGRDSSFDNAKKILNVAKEGKVIELNVASNTEWEVELQTSGASSWVTGITPKSVSPSSSTDAINNRLSFTVAPNTGVGANAREAVVIVKSKADNTKRTSFTIKQPK